MSNHIQELREGLGLSKKDLADKIYCSANHIYVVEKQIFDLNNSKHFATLSRVASVFGCQPKDLTDPNFSVKTFLAQKYLQEESEGSDYSKTQPPLSLQNPERIKAEDLDRKLGYIENEEQQDTLTIPLLDSKVCCGNGIFDLTSEAQESIPLAYAEYFFDTTFKQQDIKNKRYLICKTEGDSMEPYIPENSTILVDLEDKNINMSRSQFLLQNDSEAKIIREITLQTNGKYDIVAFNKDYKTYSNYSYQEMVDDVFGGKLIVIGKIVKIITTELIKPDIKQHLKDAVIKTNKNS